MTNKKSTHYYTVLDDGRELVAHKNSVGAWVVRVDNDTLPNVYEKSHLVALEKAKEILGVTK